MMTTPKKKGRLSLEQRVKILGRLENGEKSIDLACEFGISLPAITYIKKNKENILQQKNILDQCSGKASKRKFMRVENTQLEQSVYRWFVQKRTLGHPVSGPMLQEKAVEYNRMIQGTGDFKASNGWLQKFRDRHNIRVLSIQGEKLSANLEASTEFCLFLSDYLSENNIDMDRVYNADETGLFWKMLPHKTFVTTSETQAPGRKKSKDRVTVMVCANATGTHKIPLFVVGKSKSPRCFKNVKCLPVEYRGRPSAWMDRALTLDWYKEIFLPEILKRHGPSGRKCLLLLDNAPSHPPAEVFNAISDVCSIMYLPPNATSLIQPMDQGIIEKIKKLYKKNLLRLVLAEDTTEDIECLLKSINMLSCCNFIANAWDAVTPLNIHKCWKNLLVDLESPATNETDDGDFGEILEMTRQLPDCQEMTMEQTTSWLHQDLNEPGWQILDDQSLVHGDDLMDEANELLEAEEEEEEDGTEHLESTAKDALRGVSQVISYYQTRWDCTTDELAFLQKFKDYILDDIISEKLWKQNQQNN